MKFGREGAEASRREGPRQETDRSDVRMHQHRTARSIPSDSRKTKADDIVILYEFVS